MYTYTYRLQYFCLVGWFLKLPSRGHRLPSILQCQKMLIQVVYIVTVSMTDVLCFEGEYYSDCKITAPSKHALDEKAAEDLWKRSEEWTKL